MQRQFKRSLGFVILLVVAGCGSLSAQPAVNFLQTEYDLGEVSQRGGVVARAFAFVNRGDEPLVILSAETSCTCTKTAFSKKPIMPGDSSAINVTYDPRKQGPTLFKAINVYTNAPQNRYVITLRGKVTP